MYNKNISIHFIGIGGVGMAGIAEVLINMGYDVTGSDLKSTLLTDHLCSLGARIFYGHQESNIPLATTVVVYSSAIRENNPELIESRKRQLVIIPRAEMLAELMRMKYGIAIAGSHGKTSTTSMTAKLLQDLGFDPTVIIGGRVLTQNTGASVGRGQYLVAEADESDGSFCLLKPAMALVTNIDSEHMSFYATFGALEEAFLKFMNSVPFYGLVSICGDDPVLSRLSQNIKRKVVTFGINPNNQICAHNISIEGFVSTFNLIVHGKDYGKVVLPIPGHHMISNCLGAISIALDLGVSPEEVVMPISTFPGVSRRTELVGYIGKDKEDPQSITIIDDYGHHPAEIKATLKAIKEGLLKKKVEGAKLIVIFQPHRYTRTKELFTDFLSAFDDADMVFFSDIYPAGEEPIEGVSSLVLSESMRHPYCSYVGGLQSITPEAFSFMQRGDVVVTMGAGSINKFSHDFFKELVRAKLLGGQVGIEQVKH